MKNINGQLYTYLNEQLRINLNNSLTSRISSNLYYKIDRQLDRPLYHHFWNRLTNLLKLNVRL